MNKLKIYIVGFLFFTFNNSFADIATCENGDINYSGSVFNDICNGGDKLTNIIDYSSHSGAIQQIEVGSFGNNHNLGEKQAEVYNYHIGFLGSYFQGRTVTDIYDIAPVGLLSHHTGVDFPFRERFSLTYSDGEKADLFGVISNFGNDGVISCPSPDLILDADIKIKNDEYSEYIELSWKKHDDKIKIMQILPNQKTIYLESSEIFREYNLKNHKNYYYYIVAYNDCGGLRYSDMLNIKYEKVEDSLPYLSLENEILKLNNTEIITNNKVKLICSIEGNNIVDDLLEDDYIYSIDTLYLDKPFSCYAEYFNLAGENIKTPLFINDIALGSYVSNRETLQILLGIEDIDSYFETNLNHLYNVVDLDERLDYYSLSIFLININAKVPLVDRDLTLKTLKSINIITPEQGGRDVVSTYIFLSMLNKINSSTNFSQDILVYLNTNFYTSDDKLFNDVATTYVIKQKLKNLNLEQKEIILDCYRYLGCSDFELYKNFDVEVKDTLYNQEYKNFDIRSSSISRSWKEYVYMIYKVFGKQSYYNSNHNINEYDKLLYILVEAVFYGEDIGDDNIDYLSYLRLKNSLLNSDLDTKLKKIINYLPEINTIYLTIDDKSRLLKVIKEFLEK